MEKSSDSDLVKLFTQEQLNIVAKSYEDEVRRLLQLKVNYELTILSLKNEIAELKKNEPDRS